MSEAQVTGSSGGIAGQQGSDPVRAAIAQAAQRTGVDFRYLLAQAKLESSLDPNARAPTSSAAGLYQFTRGTWLQTLDRHADAHGLSWAGDAISGGRISDFAMAPQIMALRYDPQASALMAAELARDNGARIAGVLGRQPDAPELYLGHFLGADGASRFLTALSATPERSAASLFPDAAAANRGIFYDGGAPRSLSGVMDLIRAKVTGAMADEGGGAWAEGGGFTPQPAPRSGGLAQANALPVDAAGRKPMADTLRDAFGLGAGGSENGSPAFVRTAYGKLARMGF